MNAEFFEAIEDIEKEKGIPRGYMYEKIKQAMLAAFRKDNPECEDNVEIILDEEKKRLEMNVNKTVVEEVEDPSHEIILEAAKKYSRRAKVGDVVPVPVETKKFGRIAAQAAKQQIMQIIRDVEKETITEKMGDKVGDIILAKVERVDPVSQNVVLKIDGSEVALPRSKQLYNDEFFPGDIAKVYVVYLSSGDSQSPLKISRTHPNFVRRLFELEVPEISDGKIEIKKVAREAGVRSKVAVYSNDPNLEPVGCCIGNRGIRINSVVSQLAGEKIDIIRYSDDPKEFVSQALSPAKVLEVEILDEPNLEKVAFVSVPEDQISLAIGNHGLNAKLAAMITGFKIDINPQSGFYGEDSSSSLKQKLQARLQQQLEKQSQKQKKQQERPPLSPEELVEEADIHAFEVEAMLEEERNSRD